MSDPDPRIRIPRAIEAAWPDLLANLQTAYADLVNTRFDLERRAAELQESHDLLREVIAAMSEALFLVDRAGRIVQVNPAAGALLGSDEPALVGRLFSQLCAGPDVPITPWAILQRAPRGAVSDVAATLRTRAGQGVPVRLSCSVVRDRVGKINGVLVIAQDERPQRSLQQKLVLAGRLAAYERFAGALAAELRGPLAALGSEIQALRAGHPPDPPAGRETLAALERLEHISTRLASLDRFLRDLGGPAHGAFAPVDLNDLIDKSLLLLELQIRAAGVALVRELSPGLPPVQGSAHELGHVILSLAANACEAFGESAPAVRRIGLRTWADQGQVGLAVSDTGQGIRPEVLPHIFEPLFTTKPAGAGLGLGLAYSREVAQRHGGQIGVISQPGQGSTFTLTLPALSAPKAVDADAAG